MLNIKKLAQLFFGNGCEQTYVIFTDAEFVTNRAKPPRTYKLMSFSLYMPNIENYWERQFLKIINKLKI